MEPIVQILQEVSNFTGIGVLALLVVAFIIAMQKGIITKQGISFNKDCPPDSLEEVKNILQLLVSAITGPEGLKENDLTHVQRAIDLLGKGLTDMNENIVALNKSYEHHDRQAWEIKQGVNEIKSKMKIPITE
jgi:hypothetical protein